MERKYAASTGEPDSFDFDGTLRDSKLTLKQARAMLATMAEAVPQIVARGPIEVRFGYSKRVSRRGTFCEGRLRNRWTGEIVRQYRHIILHVHRGGATEKTMLHELAHACASRGAHHGPEFSEWCLRLQAVWLDLSARAAVSQIQTLPDTQALLSYSIAADGEVK